MAGPHKMDVDRKSSDGPAALLYVVPWGSPWSAPGPLYDSCLLGDKLDMGYIIYYRHAWRRSRVSLSHLANRRVIHIYLGTVH